MLKPSTVILLLTLTLLYWPSPVFAEKIAAIHHSVELNSSLTQHRVNLDVYLPHNYVAGRQQPYPVLYTTAGDSRFELLQAQIAWLSHTSFSPVPQLVIVRVPRLSFAGAEALSDRQYYALLAKVLRQEVQPALNTRFNLAPFSIIEGYSSRGNMALALLQHANGFFNAAVILALFLVANSLLWADAVIAALKEIYDPEIPVNIYDLGLIYNVEIDEGHVMVTMTLTTPHCPVAESMPGEVELRVGAEALEPVPSWRLADRPQVAAWGQQLQEALNAAVDPSQRFLVQVVEDQEHQRYFLQLELMCCNGFR